MSVRAATGLRRTSTNARWRLVPAGTQTRHHKATDRAVGPLAGWAPRQIGSRSDRDTRGAPPRPPVPGVADPLRHRDMSGHLMPCWRGLSRWPPRPICGRFGRAAARQMVTNRPCASAFTVVCDQSTAEPGVSPPRPQLGMTALRRVSVSASRGVPAALAPTGMSVSCPKERLDGHALMLSGDPGRHSRDAGGRRRAGDFDGASPAVTGSRSCSSGCPQVVWGHHHHSLKSYGGRIRSTCEVQTSFSGEGTPKRPPIGMTDQRQFRAVTGGRQGLSAAKGAAAP
jgi:hypothetical protein